MICSLVTCWNPRFSDTNVPSMRADLIDLMLLRIPDLEMLNKVDNILFESPPLSFIRNIAKLVLTVLYGVGFTLASTYFSMSSKAAFEMPRRSM